MSFEPESTEASAPNTLGMSTGVAMRRLVAQVVQASANGMPVTLLGEPGSGRSFFARAIHRASAWADGAFVEIAFHESIDIAAMAARHHAGATFLLLDVDKLVRADQVLLGRALAHEAFHRDDRGSRARVRLVA